MKYWRGYLVAGIMAVLAVALSEFAQLHTVLVDMIYPYMTRMVIGTLADWSATVPVCLWQVLLLLLIAGGVASAVLMVLLRWHPVQWLGWVLAVVSCVSLMNTALYGLNDFAGPIADDVHLEMTQYTVAELSEAAIYYRDQANDLAKKISRDSTGKPQFDVFDDLAVQAASGFRTLAYEENLPIFAGTTVPVKELSWKFIYTAKGVSGMTVALTGEAAVNPDVPTIAMPFAICQEMSRRLSISGEENTKYAAYLACRANTSEEFQYSAYCIAYYHCYSALAAVPTQTAQAEAAKVAAGVNQLVKCDLEDYEAFFGAYSESEGNTMTDMLTCWYIQTFITPLTVEEEDPFNPLDPEMVDLSYTDPDPIPLEQWEKRNGADG